MFIDSSLEKMRKLIKMFQSNLTNLHFFNNVTQSDELLYAFR